MGWPGNFGGVGGLNPAAFQLNQNPNAAAMPQYVNPNVLGGGGAMQQQPHPGAQQWAQHNAQFNHAASSPTPSGHPPDASMSRHTSATPAPQLSPDANVGNPFDPSVYGWS